MTPTVIDTGQPDEEQHADRFTDLVRRLSHQSVLKHFDAYTDVDWDHPDNTIDPADPRWALTGDDPLGGTDWYTSLPADQRARLGLHTTASNMKAGLQFENVLNAGCSPTPSASPTAQRSSATSTTRSSKRPSTP